MCLVGAISPIAQRAPGTTSEDGFTSEDGTVHRSHTAHAAAHITGYRSAGTYSTQASAATLPELAGYLYVIYIDAA